MTVDAINLRRDDFVPFSDGSSMFDVILDRLLIPKDKQDIVFEITFQIKSFDYIGARRSNGRIINKQWLYTVEAKSKARA
jgi:hypothetical protein